MDQHKSALHTAPGITGEKSAVDTAADQERILGEARFDRAEAQGQLLAAIFTLPSRIINSRLPERLRLALPAALERHGVSFRRALRDRPGRGR